MPDPLLRQHRGTESGRYQNADLPGGRHVADGCPGERVEDQDVGEGTEEANTERLPLRALPATAHGLRAVQHPGAQQQRVREAQAPEVDDRREVLVADGLLVPERIGGDRDAGQQGERDPRFLCATWASGEREDGAYDQRRSGQRQRTRSFAEEGDRDDRGQQRAGAARERIDEREVAVAVTPLQQHEVEAVERPLTTMKPKAVAPSRPGATTRATSRTGR